ncbi:hypothetical protein FRB95_006512 [Tulasnella sp. JGI-2019a]|nr:hypothetical protein FRB95_006512 [Tulasnella sp. JGI-2019a]
MPASFQLWILQIPSSAPTSYFHFNQINMPFWETKEDEETWQTSHNEVINAPHKAALSHELIAAAASYEAAKAFEKHEEEHGKPVSHEKAKELLAGISGAFVDHIVETKGLDFVDREKAKRDARKQVEEQLANQY